MICKNHLKRGYNVSSPTTLLHYPVKSGGVPSATEKYFGMTGTLVSRSGYTRTGVVLRGAHGFTPF